MGAKQLSQFPLARSILERNAHVIGRLAAFHVGHAGGFEFPGLPCQKRGSREGGRMHFAFGKGGGEGSAWIFVHLWRLALRVVNCSLAPNILVRCRTVITFPGVFFVLVLECFWNGHCGVLCGVLAALL